MIPPFDTRGLLPPGVYDSSIVEINATLGRNPIRQKLVQGLTRYLNVWNRSGFISEAYIDGSFVTSKVEPQDVDLILVAVQSALYSKDFASMVITYSNDRDYTRQEYGCEGFIVTGSADLPGWLEFFGHDRLGRERGLLRVGFPP